MLPTKVLNRFLERCPAVVMVRATLERLLDPKRLDQIFEDSSKRQYSKKLLFSQIVALMAAVATRTRTSVHAAYLAMQKQFGVTAAAFYEKLNHVEPETPASFVRETAADAAQVIDALPAANGGETLSMRRVSLHLDRPAESGVTEIHIVTNLSADDVTGSQVAEVHGTRWTVEAWNGTEDSEPISVDKPMHPTATAESRLDVPGE